MSSELLEFWRQRDLEQFKATIKNDVPLNYLYPEEGYCSLLEAIAVTLSPESRDFALALMEGGASLDLINPMTGKAPLHLAAEKLNHPVMQLLLTSNADVNVQDLTGSTVLHLLARKVAPHLDSAHEECLDLVLGRHDLYLNHVNSKGLSPVLMAYEQGAWRVMLKLLKAGAYVENIDYESEGKRSLRDEIKERCPEILSELPNEAPRRSQVTNTAADANHLFSYLDSSSEDRFCYYLNIYVADKKRNDSETTIRDCQQLLLKAIESELIKPVEALVKVITTTVTDKKDFSLTQALNKACEVGNVNILEIICEADPLMAPDHRGRTALHILASVNEFTSNHEQCFKQLMKHIDINCKDNQGRTPLHYANNHTQIIHFLLQNDANIFITDENKIPAFQNIPYDLLCKYFDSAIELQKDTGDFYFNFDFLRPLSNEEHAPLMSGEKQNMESECREPLRETKQLALFDESDHSSVLRHPIFHVFVAYKWKLCRPLYYVQLLLSTIFTTSLMVVVGQVEPTFSTFLKVILILYVIVNTSRWCLKIASSPFIYLKSNFICFDLVLYFLTTVIIFWNNSNESLFYFISSTTILMASLKLLIQVGQHPKISLPLFIACDLFFNTIKILSVYFIIFFAFALVFSLNSRVCDGLPCSTVFLGGFIFEIPYVETSRGHIILKNTTLPFILFFLTALTAFIHLIGKGVVISKQITSFSQFHRTKIQVQVLTSFEDKLIEFCRHLKIIAKKLQINSSFTDRINRFPQKILIFENNQSRLRLIPNNGNILQPFDCRKQKNSFWNPPVRISPAIVNILFQHVKSSIKVNKSDENEKNALLNGLVNTTENILERMRLNYIALEKLEVISRETENLLIQSLRISNLSNE